MAFLIHLQDIDYCGINMVSPDVECKYRDRNQDHNGLYMCMCPMRLRQ